MGKIIQDNNPKPVITVIIPFHGQPGDLLNCLDSLKKQNFKNSFEIIVVESGNNNELLNIKLPVNVIVKSIEALVFSGEARNIGADIANTDLLAFTDADCVIDSKWLTELYSSLLHGNEIVAGPIFNLFPFHPVASVDNLLQFADFQNRSLKIVTHFPGCNFGMYKYLFNKTKGYKGKFKNGEDVIFSEAAIKEANGKVIFNPNMIVKHAGRKDIKTFMSHHKSFGFYRGLLRLRLNQEAKAFNATFLYAFLFGLRRLGYISARTLQRNPLGALRLIFYFPIVISGLAAWSLGFWKGNKKFLENNSSKNQSG